MQGRWRSLKAPASPPQGIPIHRLPTHFSIAMYEQNFGLLREGTSNAVLRRIPIPKLRDDYVLVRTVAIALNPTDWTTIDAPGEDGTIVGCDFSGIVEEVGTAVTKPFKKGNRVAGFAHGGEYPTIGICRLSMSMTCWQATTTTMRTAPSRGTS